MAQTYFEDIKTGQVTETEPKKVTQDMITIFAYLTGDVNPLHIDEGLAKAGPFGGIVAHGLFTVSVAVGLLYSHNLLDGMILRKFDEINFIRPVYANDSIYTKFVVVGKDAYFIKIKEKHFGQISCRVDVLNQKDKPVVATDFKMLVEHKNGPT